MLFLTRSFSIVLGAFALLAPAATATEFPVTVSPGSPEGMPSISQRCPTFNWGSVTGATSYELVVYAVDRQDTEEATSPAVRVVLPGSASGWTPAEGDCLAPGGRYSWLIRADLGGVVSRWSEPAFFRIDGVPAEAELLEAVSVVQRYLNARGTAAAPDPVASTRRKAAGDSTARSAPRVGATEAVQRTETARKSLVNVLLDIAGFVEADGFLGDGSLLTRLAPPVTIQYQDFDASTLSVEEWSISFNAGAGVSVDTSQSTLYLETIPNVGVGTAVISGTRTASVLDGTLIFTARIIDTYVDHAIYGDAQPRGLVAGTDRNNAIEFISVHPVPDHVACRTVDEGAVTQTDVGIGQSVRTPNVYQIVAKPDLVRFYINGELKCTHSTNIPTEDLNIYFSTGDSGAGDVPVSVDHVVFQRSG